MGWVFQVYYSILLVDSGLRHSRDHLEGPDGIAQSTFYTISDQHQQLSVHIAPLGKNRYIRCELNGLCGAETSGVMLDNL